MQTRPRIGRERATARVRVSVCLSAEGRERRMLTYLLFGRTELVPLVHDFPLH